MAAVLLALQVTCALAMPAEEDWLFRDTTQVNEGELRFMQAVPAHAHQHHNIIHIGLESLSTGWVKLRQCHRNMDMVGNAQIVFNRERIRNLKLESFSHIREAWAEDASIQMRDIGRGAELCLSAESRALHSNHDGSFSLRNGPFMRRFLDGYYPMHVTLSIQMPAALQLQAITPEAQPGLTIHQEPGLIKVDAHFEGRLNTDVRLSLTPLSPDRAP